MMNEVRRAQKDEVLMQLPTIHINGTPASHLLEDSI
jgi:hypothetical protein